jgi:adenine-specific DNA-methyltransferase
MTGIEKINGVVNTPLWIVDLILDMVGYKGEIYNKRIIDPSCGEGNFLVVVLERFLGDCANRNLRKDEIQRLLCKNIWGFDIDASALDKCRANLDRVVQKYGIDGVEWSILQMDSLDRERVRQFFGTFDFVVGNPPYVRIQHLGEERRKRIQRDWSFCRRGSTDMYIAFFELGLNLLNERGRLGFITPNTFFKTRTAEPLRAYLMGNKIIKNVIDFGYHQIFEGVTTYSAITILDRGWDLDKFSYYSGNSEGEIRFVDEIELSDINSKRWILASKSELKRVREIESRGVPLGKIARIHAGIQTSADDFYIFENPVFEGDRASLRLRDGRVFTIERSLLKPIVKVSTLRSPDEDQNRWIIFPYKKVDGKYRIIPENEMKEFYPLTYRYFLAIKDVLLLRDKGKKSPIVWYAFGRSQGLDTGWGKKILVSPLSPKPNFIVWEKEEYTFYAGYCIKFDGDLHWLAKQLNSEDMSFYIKHNARDYQKAHKSYAKSFLYDFGIIGYDQI